jgi:hypothetical protein
MSILAEKQHIFEEDYVKIPLFNNKKEIIDYFIIDEDKYEEVNKYSWVIHIKKISNTEYRSVQTIINNKMTNLSHFIQGKPKGKNIIDNNALDNRFINLQEVPRSHNSQNKKKMSTNASSKYIGVCFSKRDKKWQASCAGKSLGLFENEIDAAKIYDKYVLVKYGKNASTNNLVSYEEVKDLTLEDIKPSKKERDLPLNIYKSHTGLYFACITYDKKEYRSTCTVTLEETIYYLKNIKEKINKIKEEKKNLHNSKEITRNSDGDAVIYIYNKDKEKIAETIVDDNLWHHLSNYGWYSSKNYIQATINTKIVILHRYIKNCPDNKIVDHIDGNSLNNKKNNLRITNKKENSYNKSKSSKTKNTFKGVYKNKKYNTYRSAIYKDGIGYNLGSYKDELCAALAYNLKAEELFGDFSNLNKIELDDETYNNYKTEINNKWNK